MSQQSQTERDPRSVAAERRRTEQEAADLEEIDGLWHLMDDETRKIMRYINERIHRLLIGADEPIFTDDVSYLRETRKIHLRRVRYGSKKDG